MKIKKSLLTMFLVAGISFSSAFAQDYSLTFAILGSADKPTEIAVENITQGTDTTLFGSDILNLVKDVSTGIPDANATASSLLQVYPNPMKESATVVFNNPSSGKVIASLCNTAGMQLASISSEMPQGEVSYIISGLSTGSYVLHAQTPDSRSSCIILSQLESTGMANIEISSINAISDQLPYVKSAIKSSKSNDKIVQMQYNSGDVLNFTATLDTNIARVNNYIATQDDEIEFSFTYTKDYYITYHNVGTKNAVSNPVTYTIETPNITLAAPNDSINYFFGGWFTDSAFNDTVSTPVILQGSTGDTAFYAKWISSSFIDNRDGNVYNWVKIGNQVWMAENLKYLPSVTKWLQGSQTTPYHYVYGYYDTVVADAKAIANYTTYGVLYNWPAAMNGATSSTTNPSGVQGACPLGWHLPSYAEWKTLEDYLIDNGYNWDGSTSLDRTGKSLANTSGWEDNLTEGNVGNDQQSNNSSGFTALPGGYRAGTAAFINVGSYGYWWMATDGSTTDSYIQYLHSGDDDLKLSPSEKSFAFSVRCVRD